MFCLSFQSVEIQGGGSVGNSSDILLAENGAQKGLKEALFEVDFWNVGISFSKNRQKLLSAAVESFLRVV